MKKTLLATLIVFFCSTVYSQNNFEVTTTGNIYSLDQISAAFNNADFCGSYYNSKRNKIELNDGSVIELKSKVEILESGINIAPSCFMDDATIYNYATWSISGNGSLLKAYDSQSTNPIKGN